MGIFMEDPVKDKYRFEKKYNLDTQYLTNFLLELNNFGFFETFEKRRINNIYYDNNSYSNFWDNVDGVSKRIKPRVRWYGELFGQSNKVLELKIKNGLVGTKKYIPIGEISFHDLDDILDHYYLERLLSQENKRSFFSSTKVDPTGMFTVFII